ncbi:MAG: hypothetical protein V3R81_07415 [Gammaproteobacteria bacterium]
MATLIVFQSAVQTDRLGDVNLDYLSVDTIHKMIKAAVMRYSKDVPRPAQVDDVTGDGGNYYGIEAELSSWVEGFSRISRIEYPAATIASDEFPIYLEDEDFQDDYWIDVSGTQTRNLLLHNHAPASTETMRITYSVPYVWTGSVEAAAIPQEDFWALVDLAAGLCCQTLAARYSQIGDTPIAADSVNHVTKAQEYAARAKMFIASYEEHFGFGDDETDQPGGYFAELDPAPSSRYLYGDRFN